MKLENHIARLMPEINMPGFRADVFAHELTHDGEGYGVNDSWCIARDADASEIRAALRGRWEVFKVNYAPRGRVKDVTDSGDDSGTVYLDCAGVPFAEIRILQPEP